MISYDNHDNIIFVFQIINFVFNSLAYLSIKVSQNDTNNMKHVIGIVHDLYIVHTSALTDEFFRIMKLVPVS